MRPRLPDNSAGTDFGHASARCRTIEALVPPKPKEFESHAAELNAVLAFAQNRHVGEGRVERLDIGAGADEAVLHHQERIDRFLHAGGAERMAGERLGGGDRRAFGAEHLADRLDLLQIADRGRGRVRIDVVDRRFHAFERHPHAAHRAFAGRLHHVVAVGSGAVAGDFAIDARAARLGMLEFFQHHHAGAAGDDEAVAVLVIGARRLLRAGH